MESVPCRETQLNALYELLVGVGDGVDPLPFSIFVSGDVATGKTLCVDYVLQYVGYKTVTFNCTDCYSLKMMYETILSNLVDDIDVRCDTMFDFINGLKLLQHNHKPVVVVFDRADRLCMDPTVMPVLLNLRKHCHVNICTIFITRLVCDSFYPGILARPPITLHFPSYSKRELFKIIFLEQKPSVHYLLTNYVVEEHIQLEIQKPELFANFLNAFLSVLYRMSRNVAELRRMARLTFVEYCEPIITNEIQAKNLIKLWQCITPILKANLEDLFLDDSSTAPGNQSQAHKCANLDLQSNLHNTSHEVISMGSFVPSSALSHSSMNLTQSIELNNNMDMQTDQWSTCNEELTSTRAIIESLDALNITNDCVNCSNTLKEDLMSTKSFVNSHQLPNYGK